MTAPLKTANPVTVGVALGDRAYDIVIGRDVLPSLGTRIAALRPGARTAIVTDRAVAAHWLAKVEAALAEAGIASSRIVVGEGEASKSYAVLQEVCEALIAAKIERNDLVIALGGGVVGDLAGFAASIVRRGVDFVQVPTSLLAQVDSSVGGKTGINSPQGKNLVGAFKQPRAVVADVATLRTLPPRELRAGLAEVAKHGLIADPLLWQRLMMEEWHIDPRHLASDRLLRADLQSLLVRAIRVKRDVIEEDPFEVGRRAVLNLGHTFAHAIEQASGYAVRHGDAVALGMIAESIAGVDKSPHWKAADHNRLVALIDAAGLPLRLPAGSGITTSALLDAARFDKKNRGGATKYMVPQAPGKVEATPVENAVMEAALMTIGAVRG